MKQVKTIRTIKQLQKLPLSVRSSLLEPKFDNSPDPVHYIFRYSVTHEGTDYQLDWASIAKELASALEVRGEPGGWIYRLVGGDGQWKGVLQGGGPICQGWGRFAQLKFPLIAGAARRALGDSRY